MATILLCFVISTINIQMCATVGWLQCSVDFSKFEVKNRSGSGLMKALNKLNQFLSGALEAF